MRSTNLLGSTRDRTVLVAGRDLNALHVTALEGCPDPIGGVESNLKPVAIRLRNRDLGDVEPEQRVLVIELLELQVLHGPEPQVHEYVMTEGQNAAGVCVGSDLERVDQYFEGWTSRAKLPPPIQVNPHDLGIVERRPVAEHRSQLLGADDPVLDLHAERVPGFPEAHTACRRWVSRVPTSNPERLRASSLWGSKRGRTVKVREVIRRLENDGWYHVGTRGSHRHYKHRTKPGRVTVSGHLRDEMAPGTLASVFRQAQILRKLP